LFQTFKLGQITKTEAYREEQNIILNGYNTESKTSSSTECFDKCDAEVMCAAACFTLPNTCRLLRYGFNQTDDNTLNSVSYIKAIVVTEIYIGEPKWNTTFPVVQSKTRFFKHYDLLSVTTPSQCFKKCKESVECDGASFTTDPTWSVNCALFHPGEFTDQTQSPLGYDLGLDMWMSYRKAAVTSTTTTTTTSTTIAPSTSTISDG
jgi:hypothetical protein